jgi:amino acid adenylation domain-containing protein
VALDVERLGRAVNRLVARHDALRTVVLPDGEQRTLESVPPYEIVARDLRGQSADAAAATLDTARRELCGRMRSAGDWPRFDVQAYRLPDGQTRLLFDYDLMIMDGWSLRVLNSELLSLYLNPNATLPSLQLSLRDYVLGLCARRDSELYRRADRFWSRLLPTLPPAPKLPAACELPGLKKPIFERLSSQLEADVWKELRSRALAARLLPTALTCAAFAEVLARWCTRPEFTLNLMYSNRLPLHPDVPRLLGNLSSTGLLAVDGVGRTFRDRAARIRDGMLAALAHSAVSGVQVLRALSGQRGRGAGAAMPVVFNADLPGGDRRRDDPWAGVPWRVVSGVVHTPGVLLDHQLMEIDGTLALYWDVVPAAFPDGLPGEMFAAYCELLRELAGGTGWESARTRVVSPAAFEPDSQSAAREPVAQDTLLHTGFEAQVARRPDQVAVSTTTRQLTYVQLYRMATRLGRVLRDAGARPNMLIAVVMEKGWEQVVGLMGVLKAGGAYLPIDPSCPRERLWHLLERGEVKLSVTQAAIDVRLEWPDGVRRIPLEPESLETTEDEPLDPIQQSCDLAYVMFTSGSTGIPKGVMIEHGAVANTIVDINRRFGVGSNDRVLALSSFGFDLSVYDIFGTLAAGGTIVMPDHAGIRDPSHWLDLMARENVTVWNSVPALLEMLLDYTSDGPRRLPDSLRLVLLSGDWIPLSLPHRIEARVDGVRVISLGGATEAAIWSIYHPIQGVDPKWKSIPYGRALGGQETYVLDESLNPCPTWVVGSIHIGGVGLARGYWRDETGTASSFIRHPRTGQRLYRTGDRGRYLPDASIELLGRDDSQLKVRGFRIEPAEVEAAICQHPNVRASVVSAIGDGASEKQIVCYFVPSAAGSPSGRELQSFLQRKLPDYMIPSAWVPVDALPLTGNGKVDRRALPSLAQERPPPSERRLVPRNHAEERLLQLWSEILKTNVIGIDDNFFEVGGNSLLAVQMLVRIERLFNTAISLVTLLQRPTVAELASVLDGNKVPDARSSLVRLQPLGFRRPLFCAHALGGNVVSYIDLARNLRTDRPIYAFKATGLEVDELPLTSIASMATRYIAALRTLQPAGPYLLAGWSMGAVIAFEMAQQLAGDGADISLLALFDPPLPARSREVVGDEDAITFRAFGEEILRAQGAEPASADLIRIEELCQGPALDRLPTFVDACKRAMLLSTDIGIENLERFYRVFQANARALWSYTPHPYAGRLTLFRAAASEDAPAEASREWQALAAGGHELFTVPGSHYTMLHTPNVNILADLLEASIDDG